VLKLTWLDIGRPTNTSLTSPTNQIQSEGADQSEGVAINYVINYSLGITVRQYQLTAATSCLPPEGGLGSSWLLLPILLKLLLLLMLIPLLLLLLFSAGVHLYLVYGSTPITKKSRGK
jgi:hypothetical protein